jgi:hypothetical protein
MLQLNSPREFSIIREISNGNIIKKKVEILSTSNKSIPNKSRRNLMTMCKKLLRIKLSNNILKNFINKRRKNLLSILKTKISNNSRKTSSIRTRENM